MNQLAILDDNENRQTDINTILQIDEDNPSPNLNPVNNIEELEDEDPAEHLTKHDISTSPWSKFGVVGLVFGVGFSVVFLFFSGIFNSTSEANNEDIPPPIAEETLARLEQNDGDVYAQAALGKQEVELKKINQKTPKTEENTTATIATKPVSTTANPSPPTPTPKPRRTSSPSSPVNRSTRQAINTSPSPRSFATSPTRNLSIDTSTAITTDPIAELNRLRRVGSFGNISYGNHSATTSQRTVSRLNNDFTPPPTPTRDSHQISPIRPTGGGIERIEPRWRVERQQQATNNFQLASLNYLPQEAQIINERRNRYLVVGSFASGELVTPLVKEQSTDRNNQPTDHARRYVAKLTQDLKDNYGNIAIARGSLMALEMLSVDGASYAQVQVTSIIKDKTEYPISAGAITVQGDGGRPLIAQQYKDKGGEIAQYDLTVGLVSGLGKVGEIINRPDVEDEIEDELFGTIRRRTRSQNRRDIGGAMLEGAFGSLSEIIGRRAETSTQEILARPNVWYIPSNTKVTFLVNRTLELP